MQKLTNKEEEIMHILWKLKKAFVKNDAEITEDQPHYNTLSTIVRNLEERDTLPRHENASILPHHYRGLQKRVYEYGN
jgi:predicted transcriptional regulator